MLLVAVIIVMVMAFFMELAAIALKLTGMNMEKARFQALSAVTGTGFTTREAEDILGDKKRRKIIMALMITGNAGLVSLIITTISTLQGDIRLYQILIAGFLLLVLIRYFSSRVVLQNLDDRLEKVLSRQMQLRKKTVEEVLQLNDQYSILDVVIEGDCPLQGKRDRSQLKGYTDSGY